MPEEELKAKAADVNPTFQLDAAQVELVPLRTRVNYGYAAVAAPDLKAEFMRFVPFFLECALGAPRVAWPLESGPKARVRLARGPSTGPASLALLSATLAPPRTVTSKVRKSVRAAWEKRNDLTGVSSGQLFVLAAGVG